MIDFFIKSIIIDAVKGFQARSEQDFFLNLLTGVAL